MYITVIFPAFSGEHKIVRGLDLVHGPTLHGTTSACFHNKSEWRHFNSLGLVW